MDNASNGSPPRDEDSATRERRLADNELAWNQRYFRPGVWRADFMGGRDFTRWNLTDKEADPDNFFPLLRPLLPLQFGRATLICGHDVAEFLLRNKKKPEGIIFLSAATMYPMGFSRTPCWAVNPHHALLIATTRRPGFTEPEYHQYAHTQVMIDPGQGVFIGSPVG